MATINLYYETLTNVDALNPSILDMKFANRTYVNVKRIAIVGYSVPRLLINDQFIRFFLPEIRKDWPIPVSDPYKFVRGNKYYPLEYEFKPVMHAMNRILIHINDSHGNLVQDSDFDTKSTVSMILEIECEDVKLQS